MAQDYRENVILAMDTLRAHKLRSFLTVLGVVMGVAVLMLVAALLSGFDQNVTSAITGYGVDTAFISRFQVGPLTGRPRPKEERERKPLTLEDGQAILESCPTVKNLTVWIAQWEQPHQVRYQRNEVTGIDFRGAFSTFPLVYANATMRKGRFFTEAENLHREKVVVIGENVADALFPNLYPIGKDILVDGSTFRVVGVIEKAKTFSASDEDRRVIIPYYSFRKIYPAAYEQNIRIQAQQGQLERAVDEAREVLRRRRNVGYTKPDNFSIQTSQQAVEQFHAIVGMVALAMVVLSSIGLLIGGVGVMNIMLVSVTERTREIGVRKAIGARSRDITWQFLFEAMALTGSGGVIGILLTSGLVLLIRRMTEMNATVPFWAILVGLAVSVTVGLIFGVWPAVKAAKLDPVEALRYE
ncbi:MAG TPA: ABC transporter permease [Candidatus Acidoferrales bacterium]|nr:ABC transporter permease [Candidatus Acidoferrales bacterium]